MGRSIVVDVSVARGAGVSGKPQPEACRRVLATMRDFGHQVAMSKDVYNEWIKLTKGIDGQLRTYASLIAIQWLKDMRSSGRVDDIALEENSALRQRCLQGLQQNSKTSSSVAPVTKDFHLVETALKSDNRVLSLDQKMFAHLGHLQEIANDVCQVMWVNPVINQAEEWLKNDAPDTSEYHVCNFQG
jgi:hypothetical protein